MLHELGRDLRTALVAVLATTALSGTAAAAAATFADQAANADKVDQKHAVGYGATKVQRAGKLVATNSNGVLPDNAISGRVSFRSDVPPGVTVRGYWSIDDQDETSAAGGDWGTSVSYPGRMPGLAVSVVPPGGTTASCQGSVAAPTAAPGNLCVYTNSSSAFGLQYQTGFATASSNDYGAGWYFTDDGNVGDVYVSGTWAAQVAASTARVQSRTPSGK